MKRIGYMPLNGGIMDQVTGPQKDRLQPVHNWPFWFLTNWATGNCSPVVISCGPIQLPVFVPVANWTSKHYSHDAPLLIPVSDLTKTTPVKQSIYALCIGRLVRSFWLSLLSWHACNVGNMVMDVGTAHDGWSRTTSGTWHPPRSRVIFLCPRQDMCPLWWTLKAKVWKWSPKVLWQVLQHLWVQYSQNDYHSVGPNVGSIYCEAYSSVFWTSHPTLHTPLGGNHLTPGNQWTRSFLLQDFV